MAAAFGLLAVVSLWLDMAPYRRVLGAIEPALAVMVLLALGVPALVALDRSGLFAFSEPNGRRRGLTAAAVLAVMFASLVVLVDVVAGFPPSYNVPPRLPQSLLFYAVIGYVAEMAFHAIPMAVIVTLLASRGHGRINEKTLRLAMIAVACIEPVFQMRLGVSGAAAGIAWVELFVAMHVFAINLVQLGLYHQFDFLVALGFRLVYYLLWHILWGVLRQDWLF